MVTHNDGTESEQAPGLTGTRWWLATGLVLAIALAATLPTTGDIGLTWDEPAYRYSQVVSAQWWERLARARSASDLAALVEPNTLLYYWQYGRFGMNFHNHTVRACCHRCPRNRDHIFRIARSMTGISHYWQVCQRFQRRNTIDIESITGRLFESADAPFAQHDSIIAVR